MNCAKRQAASKASSACVLFLFEGSAVNTETKYAFAIIGVFLMGFTNEMVRWVTHTNTGIKMSFPVDWLIG